MKCRGFKNFARWKVAHPLNFLSMGDSIKNSMSAVYQSYPWKYVELYGMKKRGGVRTFTLDIRLMVGLGSSLYIGIRVVWQLKARAIIGKDFKSPRRFTIGTPLLSAPRSHSPTPGLTWKINWTYNTGQFFVLLYGENRLRAEAVFKLDLN